MFIAGTIKGRRDRAAERARQWWTAFTWTFDRATTTTSTALAPNLTTALLDRLSKQGDTRLEQEVVNAMSRGLYSDPKPPDEPAAADEEAESA